MEPDERLYATLIAAAGSAGRLPLAFELRDEMRLEGLVPGEVCATGPLSNARVAALAVPVGVCGEP